MTDRRIRELIKNRSVFLGGFLLTESQTLSIIKKCRGLNNKSIEFVIKTEVERINDGKTRELKS